MFSMTKNEADNGKQQEKIDSKNKKKTAESTAAGDDMFDQITTSAKAGEWSDRGR